MSKTKIAGFFWCVVCGVIVSTAWSADDSLRETFQSRYTAMKAAMAAHDGAAMAAILAPNFVSVDLSGHSETASQMIAEVNGLKPDPNKSSTTTVVSVDSATTSVTVVQRYDMKTIRTDPDGTSHNIELVTISTDTWVKPANAWLIDKTVTDELSYFKDGKLVAHQVKPTK